MASLTAPTPEDTERSRDEWARNRGWRQLKHGSICPLRVAGKRCRRGYANAYQGCICARYSLSVFDHARLWRTRDGDVIFTAEPYQVYGDDLADVIGKLAEYGVRLDVSGYSPYYPGGTLLITCSKDNTNTD